MQPEKVSLLNICSGAVEEIFQREMKRILENIRDVNTADTAKRELTLKFTFKPYPDRSGATVEFATKSGLANVEAVNGTIHITAATGELAAFPRDPRQEMLFEPAMGAKQ